MTEKPPAIDYTGSIIATADGLLTGALKFIFLYAAIVLVAGALLFIWPVVLGLAAIWFTVWVGLKIANAQQSPPI